MEDMKDSEIQNVEGTVFTSPRKQGTASQVKERVMNAQHSKNDACSFLDEAYV